MGYVHGTMTQANACPLTVICLLRYGTLMLNTEGMTPEGIERKATCQNLFRKLLFLTGVSKQDMDNDTQGLLSFWLFLLYIGIVSGIIIHYCCCQ
jgi:hypothetical protein